MTRNLTEQESAEAIQGASAGAYAARSELLRFFVEDPDNPRIWETAYSWVAFEDDTDTRGIVGDIPGWELIAFAERIRSEGTSGARYVLTAETAPNGRPWFEVLTTFSSEQIEQAKIHVVAGLVEGRGKPFDAGLDLATGTGLSLGTVEQFTSSVVGIDREPRLLAIARRRAHGSTSLQEADATALPFPDGSFDLVASSGLSGLDRTSSERVYRELARVLTPDGIYVEGGYAPNEDGGLCHELSRIRQTSKGLLADMIVDTVSGAHADRVRLSDAELGRLLDELDLWSQLFTVCHGRGEQTLIRTLVHRTAAG